MMVKAWHTGQQPGRRSVQALQGLQQIGGMFKGHIPSKRREF
jgi:hypothetical protein